MKERPPTRCPAVHPPGRGDAIALAPQEELAPALAFVRARATEPRARRFPRGVAQRDGRLDLCKQGLGVAGLRSLLDALGPGHPWLRHLLLGTNGLADEGAALLGAALQRGLAVETLYLGCNNIREPGARALATGLEGHPTVRALWLKRNPLGARGIDALVDAIARARLKTLDLTNCELGDAGVARVVDGLARAGASIEHLFLGGNGLADPAPLAAWLSDPACPLQSLFVSASRLRDRGLAALTGALTRNHTLRALDLASNGLTREGLRALSSQRHELSLAWLNLGASPATALLGERFNQFGDAAVDELAALCDSSLVRLGLRQTGLTSRGLRRLLAAVRGLEDPPSVRVGKGVARRLRRAASSLSSRRLPPPRSIRLIASVYR